MVLSTLYVIISGIKNNWLVGWFWFYGPFRQLFSLYRAVFQREGEREDKKIEESKNVQTAPYPHLLQAQ